MNLIFLSCSCQNSQDFSNSLRLYCQWIGGECTKWSSVCFHVKMYADLLLHMWVKTICLTLSLVSRHIFWKRCNHLTLALRIHLISGFLPIMYCHFLKWRIFSFELRLNLKCLFRKNTCNCSFTVVSVFKWQTEGWTGCW